MRCVIFVPLLVLGTHAAPIYFNSTVPGHVIPKGSEAPQPQSHWEEFCSTVARCAKKNLVSTLLAPSCRSKDLLGTSSDATGEYRPSATWTSL